MEQRLIYPPSGVQGFLIALEGLDGVGKTTQARKLATALEGQGLSVVLTHEPTQGRHGRQLRQLLCQGRQALTPLQELALFTADRREHVAQVIQPALAAGAIVITDRYYYSSMAYQGALGLEVNDIQRQNEAFAPIPDLVIILSLSLTQILTRLAQRCPSRWDAFEQAEYLKKVGEIYDRLSGPHIYHLEAGGTIEAVHQAVLSLVRFRLARSD